MFVWIQFRVGCTNWHPWQVKIRVVSIHESVSSMCYVRLPAESEGPRERGPSVHEAG